MMDIKATDWPTLTQVVDRGIRKGELSIFAAGPSHTLKKGDAYLMRTLYLLNEKKLSKEIDSLAAI